MDWRWVLLLTAVATLQIGCGDDDGSVTPQPCAICDTWAFTLDPVSNTGPCPATPAQQGTATITKTGNVYGFSASGVQCSPPEACVFTGTLTDSGYVFSNSGAADSQGGTFANTMVLQFSGDSAAGPQVSTYSVNGAVMCTWVTAVTLRR
jgi:hypothetical protein